MRNNPDTKIQLKCAICFKLVLKNNSLVLYKTNNDVFIRAMVRIFSFGENIHYLYNISMIFIAMRIVFGPLFLISICNMCRGIP